MLFISPKRIKGIPNVFSNIPIYGNLSLIFPPAKKWSDSPCLKFYRLSQKYGEVFQVRFGNRLVVVANSYDSIIKLWCCKSVRGNNSRPISETFHNQLSREGIYTIGTTPFGPDYLKMRKFVSSNVLNGKSGKGYNGGVISRETNRLILKLVAKATRKGENEDYFISDDFIRKGQYFHLAVALILTYGYQIDYTASENRLEADEIIYVENQITKIRSHVQNFQDFLPNPFRFLLNVFSGKNSFSRKLYERRKVYLEKYFKFSRENITYPNSAVRRSLMYHYFMDGENCVKRAQMASICLTMVSAGLDNTPLNFKYELHQLSHSPHVCKKAYKELMDGFENDPVKAYQNCHKELKCQYIVAIVKETLRLFTVLPMALPRETTEPITYGTAVIPKGTLLFMNSWAGNHDQNAIYKPMEFIPERFLSSDDDGNDTSSSLKHFAFGIGSRMCLGNHLAFQELYILTCKFLLLFEFQNPEMNKLNPLELNQFPESIAIEPEIFNICLKLRSKEFVNQAMGPREVKFADDVTM
ncbi:hypothetical protein FOA43_001054 [Brettanomyces nanus]|uniref:Cytochrome P450 n=1 Tax=Eeniella nana TaxID=13502 RepID=A0A875RWP7_EENNA|nr:uncharacterized protein FOA43_001054 [Brettanomyces nanus]QPG73741.1 hypothetical protein FOA43_001054 [Brettanomyces nanus]